MVDENGMKLHPIYSLKIAGNLPDIISYKRRLNFHLCILRELSYYNLPSCDKSHVISGIPETSTSPAISTRVRDIHTLFHSNSYHNHPPTACPSTMARILFISGFHPATRARDLMYEFERSGIHQKNIKYHN